MDLQAFYSCMASQRSELSLAASEGGPIESGRLRLRTSLMPDLKPLRESGLDETAEPGPWNGFGPEPAYREKPYSSGLTEEDSRYSCDGALA